MEGGRAAADLLCGAFSPSGKLPLTFAKKYEDYGSSTNFPGLGNEVLYAEDVYVGYRHFDRWDVDPLYAFGHGLSYTTFTLSNPNLSATTIDVAAGDELTLSVDVRNTGRVDAKEVVQLYVSQPRATRPKPLRQLKAFRKVAVAAGETETVSFSVSRRLFEEYNELRHEWVVEPERYVLSLGTSSRDLPLAIEIDVHGEDPYAAMEMNNPLDIFTQK
jgi:beta-glucosidase